MAKKQLQILEQHKKSDKITLLDAYKKPSLDKQHAYKECKKIFNELNGKDFKIISKNIYVFSIGFYYDKNDKLYFHYETDKTVLDFEVK